MSRKHGDPRVTEIDDFIHNKLIKLLEEDQKNWYISSEGDLQSAVYFHLRNYFGQSKETTRKWYVQNKLATVSKTKSKKDKKKRSQTIYPDIVISRLRPMGELKPYFAIELKETRQFKIGIIKKEVKKIYKLLSQKNRFQYGYVIYACLDENLDGQDKKTKKTWYGWKKDTSPVGRQLDEIANVGKYYDGENDGYVIGSKRPWVDVFIINAFTRKWYSKELEDFKRRDKKLRKYRS